MATVRKACIGGVIDVTEDINMVELLCICVIGFSVPATAEGPKLQIIYANNLIARKCRPDIEAYVCKLFAKEAANARALRSAVDNFPFRPSFVSLDSVEASDKSATDGGKVSASKLAIGSSQFYDAFIIDTIGWPLVDCNASLSEGWEIPSPEDSEGSSPPTPSRSRMKRSCFNCGGNHDLSVCTEKRDMQRINQNRRQFMDQAAISNAANATKTSRYHKEEADPRFSTLRAGVISESLREALGLKSNQLPPYIYQMRVYGYPPGHLENARQETSGMMMFGKHGVEIRPNGELLEDGEVKEDATQQVTFSFNKFVEYPGFNVDAPEGTIDEWKELQMPPMQDHQRKDAMKQQLIAKGASVISGTKRQSSVDTDKVSAYQKVAKVENDGDDMDLDESVRYENGDGEKFIVMSEVSQNTNSTPTSSSTLLQSHPSGDDIESPVTVDTPSVTPVNRCTSMGMSLGTPVDTPGGTDDDGSPTTGRWDALPTRIQFATGISDHILFENLPNATGTFQRLRTVIRSLLHRD